MVRTFSLLFALVMFHGGSTSCVALQPEAIKASQIPPATASNWVGVSRWQANQREVVLCGVLRDGPAGRAGLQANDTIVSIGGQPAPDLKTWHEVLDLQVPGKSIAFEYRRGDETSTVNVRVEALPADGGIGSLIEAARGGEAWAMMELGVRLAGFRGDRSSVDKDPAAAAEWFWKAIDAGDTAAPLFLARMYLAGEGVEKNPVVAQELLILARRNADDPDKTGVRKGLASAASNELARMALLGIIPEVPPDAIVRLLEDAARHGSPLAMVRLAALYEKGDRVARDEARMIDWYSRAAELRYAPAIEALARLQPKGSSAPDAIAGSSSGSRPSTSSAGNPRRRIWQHDNGWFRQCADGVWMETFRAGTNSPGSYSFREVNRNREYVELHDPGRDFTVRLTDDAMLLQQGKGADFARLYEGSWARFRAD